MTSTPTPALDALAAEARRYLADHADRMLAEGAVGYYRCTRAAEAAVWAVCRFKASDPLEHASRVLAAHLDLQRLANDIGTAADFAAGIIVGFERPDRSGSLPLGPEASAAASLAARCSMIADFLAHRPAGLIDDAFALRGGAADLDGAVWDA